jgi:hypothetical protein
LPERNFPLRSISWNSYLINPSHEPSLKLIPTRHGSAAAGTILRTALQARLGSCLIQCGGPPRGDTNDTKLVESRHRDETDRIYVDFNEGSEELNLFNRRMIDDWTSHNEIADCRRRCVGRHVHSSHDGRRSQGWMRTRHVLQRPTVHAKV